MKSNQTAFGFKRLHVTRPASVLYMTPKRTQKLACALEKTSGFFSRVSDKARIQTGTEALLDPGRLVVKARTPLFRVITPVKCSDCLANNAAKQPKPKH